MKPTLSHLLVPLLVGALIAYGTEESSEPLLLRVDLNGDGKAETITRRRLGGDSELGSYHQIIVSDAGGGVLWKSSEVQDATDPLAFGSWDFGVSLPELAGDIDQDGKVELLAPAPQSDVSPTFHRVLRWTGDAFKPVFSRALSGSGRRGATFGWTKDPKPQDFWVLHWLGASAEGGWVVQLYAMQESGESVRTGIAVLMPKAGSFELLRWIQPPETMGGGDGGEFTYRARLSEKDHISSTGAALTTVADVLRQDRANVHRSLHTDEEDGIDARFITKEAREELGTMEIHVEGGAEDERRVLTGTPLVEVRIEGGTVSVRVIQ